MSLKYNHEVYLYNEKYLKDLYYGFPELRYTFLVTEEDTSCLVDIQTGYCYLKVLPNVADWCYINRERWIRTDKVKDPKQYKDALKALNKIIYKQETLDKMREFLCTMLLFSADIFSIVMLCKFIDLTNTSAKLFAAELFLTLLIGIGIGLVVYLIFYQCVKDSDIKFAEIMNKYVKP